MLFAEPIAGAVLHEAWEERHLIRAFVEDFYKLVRKGRLKVFVFGCAGTGKTTFGKILEDHRKLSDLSSEYAQTIETEIYKFEGNRYVRILVPPGHEAFRFRQWEELLERMRKARRSVVINIVAGGFHSLELNHLRDVPEFTTGVSAKSKSGYLTNNRRKEINALKDIAGAIAGYTRPLHMITLVTKQDLWWKERQGIRQHYEERTGYKSQIDFIAAAKGAAHFTHHYCSVSFGQFNFRTRDGTVVQETAAGYDASIRRANFNNFLHVLKQLI